MIFLYTRKPRNLETELTKLLKKTHLFRSFCIKTTQQKQKQKLTKHPRILLF